MKSLHYTPLVGVAHLIEHLEILAASTHDVGIFQILKQVGRNLHHVVLVCGTEVHIIINDGSVVAHSRAIPSPGGESPDSRHNMSQNHDIIGIYVRIGEVQLVVWMVFIKDGLASLLSSRKANDKGDLLSGKMFTLSESTRSLQEGR